MKNLTLFNNTPADILSKTASQVVIFGSLFLFYCTMSWTGYSPVHSADEARYLMFAQNLSEGYYSPTASINIWNGPGYPIVLVTLVSWGKKTMILLNPLFMIAGIYLFFRTLLQLDYSKFMAILFSTILGLYPFMFDDLPLLMSECFSFFLVCSILFYSERFYQQSISVDAGKIIQGHRIFNGHHEIPFQIQLPKTLISSRRIVHDHDSSCVKYCLEAELKGSRLFHQYKANAEVLVQNKEETPPPLILHSWHADYLASASNSLVARRTGFCRS